MEFKSLKNIETSFRQIRLFGIVFLCLCALVSVFSVVASFRFAEKQREKIYVLDGGKSLMLALSQDLSQNRPVEAREHIRRFHELFFTLSTPLTVPLPLPVQMANPCRKASALPMLPQLFRYKSWEHRAVCLIYMK